MNKNPYTSPTDHVASSAAGGSLFILVVKFALKFIAAYVLGITSSIILTDAEMILAGKNLLPWYLVLSVVGVVLWFIAALQALPSPPFEMWWILLMIGLPFFGEAIARLSQNRKVSAWRAMWTAFPIGFVGTVGLYWVGSLSI